MPGRIDTTVGVTRLKQQLQDTQRQIQGFLNTPAEIARRNAELQAPGLPPVGNPNSRGNRVMGALNVGRGGGGGGMGGRDAGPLEYFAEGALGSMKYAIPSMIMYTPAMAIIQKNIDPISPDMNSGSVNPKTPNFTGYA
jgi:hypothetical protein